MARVVAVNRCTTELVSIELYLLPGLYISITVLASDRLVSTTATYDSNDRKVWITYVYLVDHMQNELPGLVKSAIQYVAIITRELCKLLHVADD